MPTARRTSGKLWFAASAPSNTRVPLIPALYAARSRAPSAPAEPAESAALPAPAAPAALGPTPFCRPAVLPS
eukprot:CAMPEP_0182567924 /NCGR_PEP_ID=MMETSP1324-20130603/9018_1 /TAXON_ID=236786 /ORGANISM="Florenciella sp., Strain RCC1587" /LENGTH=71 /DNA_ID=CAMNT_0024782005 /DNA_START=1 /DNA_END=215 /DNA_ORIENTATION=+